MRAILVTFLAAGMAMTAAPAAASEKSTVVSYADLDLTDPADIATLEQRISAAAKKVCTRSWDSSLSLSSSVETCRAASYKSAMEKVEALLAPDPGSPVALAD
ncbi:UrcA family protein [Altererythrobacter salegens]|uniref:UrcA family protein n=1 Tax=Croceibacterium salegens TaxID=1737568 RepID=A0A6I4SXL7_9SPHN|nr:UrcA family protein [Croceibacterium salegens]MXO59777.1 UrcA family protein [Croceibacterium salegens]